MGLRTAIWFILAFFETRSSFLGDPYHLLWTHNSGKLLVLILLLWRHVQSKVIEANTSLKLRAFMQANFIPLDSRVDDGARISWKLL